MDSVDLLILSLRPTEAEKGYPELFGAVVAVTKEVTK